jgi:hypothetical protein
MVVQLVRSVEDCKRWTIPTRVEKLISTAGAIEIDGGFVAESALLAAGKPPIAVKRTTAATIRRAIKMLTICEAPEKHLSGWEVGGPSGPGTILFNDRGPSTNDQLMLKCSVVRR